jgi:hypothetical protein
MDEKNNILTEKQMQELLPDYIFNRLSESEKEIFELNLPNFLDIQKEIEEVNAVFTKFDKIDFDNLIDRKTRNMSYHVNNRMQKLPQRSSFRPNFIRFAIPMTLMLLVSILLIRGKDLNFMQQFFPSQNEYANESMFDEELIQELIITENIDVLEIANDDELAVIYNDMLSREITENIKSENLNKIQQIELYENELNILNYLDEEDIQTILQELEDETIL